MNTHQTTIEKKLGKKVIIVKDNDGANLLYSAHFNGMIVASIYKSFDKNFNTIEVIRYRNID